MLITVRESNKGTKTSTETIRLVGKKSPRGAIRTKKTSYSQSKDAIRKRTLRADPTAREAERRRRNAANALKRKNPAHQEHLAARRNKRKLEKENLLGVDLRKTSTEPFGSVDEVEGVYEIEKWSEVEIKNYEKHTFHKKKRTDSLYSNSTSTLVSVEYNKKVPAHARTVTPL